MGIDQHDNHHHSSNRKTDSSGKRLIKKYKDQRTKDDDKRNDFKYNKFELCHGFIYSLYFCRCKRLGIGMISLSKRI